MSKRKLTLGSAIAVLGLIGCAQQDSATTTSRSEQRTDSTVARTPVPGARAIQKANNVADSAAARAARPTATDTSP